jgi:ribokinase
MNPLNIDITHSRYRTLIGVGGIGSGMFFRLNGDATLGREESRSGYFLDRKDYCKLHIIIHYVKALLGPEFEAIPVGRVGDDDIGGGLLREMADAGLVLRHVERTKGSQTLFSFCFIYPDGSGGNMTTSDSACSKVNPEFIDLALPDFKKFSNCGIALAAPEVSVEARAHLLDLATQHGFYRVASFTSEEMPHVMRSNLLKFVDLLAINLDEAAAATGLSVSDCDPQTIIEAMIKASGSIHPEMQISVTMGKDGSCCWDGTSAVRLASQKVHVESTAGAGDAFLAGLIAGVTAGLSLDQAQQLATLTGAVSVQSPHTINKDLDRKSLLKLSIDSPAAIDNVVLRLLEDHDDRHNAYHATVRS